MSAGRVIVIGAGASGMLAAGRAAESGAAVLLLEKTEQPGKKLLITGGRRCNLTNDRPLEEFIAMFGNNGRFLYGPFKVFFREELKALLGRYGLQTSIEPDGRVFPASMLSRDVVLVFNRYMNDHGVKTQFGARVEGIDVDHGWVVGVRLANRTIPTRAVVMATGGASFPGTGSSGDGYRIAERLGHTIERLRPALVPLVVNEMDCAKNMQGVSLYNVRLTSYACKAEDIDPSLTPPPADCGRGIAGRRPRRPIIESRTGNVVITHFGISGPAVLLMSLAVVDATEQGPVSVAIDLKPDISEQELDQQIRGELSYHGQRSYQNVLRTLVPPRMASALANLTGVPPDRPGHQVTAEERKLLTRCLKSFRFNIQGPLSMAAAMVTAGGVALDEINPQTMESRLVRGLYFCGEVIDLDADTGGYNLQAAFSTGYVAGERAASGIPHTQDSP